MHIKNTSKIFLKIEYHKFLSVFFHTQDSNIKVQYLQSNFFLLIWCEYHQYFLGVFLNL